MRKSEKALDRIDLKILDILQRECRISNIDLAARIDLSPTPCLERVRRLEKEGYIQQYCAHISPNKLAPHLVTYAQLSLTRVTEDNTEKLNQQLMDMDEVIESVMVAGDFDYLIKVRTKNLEQYEKFITKKLAAVHAIEKIQTIAAIKEVKSTHIIAAEYLN